MRLIATAALFLLTFSLGSCTSEYEERLEEAKILRDRYLMVEESNFLAPSEELSQELKEIQIEIEFLAKVSGNKEMFLKQINEY